MMIKYLLLVFDILACSILAILFAWWAITVWLLSHLNKIARGKKRRTGTRKILFFNPARYAELEAKGVLWIAKDRNEGGYFDCVYAINFFNPAMRVIKLSDKNFIIEYGVEKYEQLKKWNLVNTRRALLYSSLFRFATKLIRRDGIDIIRSNTPYLEGIVGLICSKLTGTPFCVSIHADYNLQHETRKPEGGPKLFGSRMLAKRLEKFVLSQAKMVMPIRDSLARYAIDHGANPEAIRVIPHGIDPSLFLQKPDIELKKQLGIEDNKVVSFVGRLAPDNYVNDVIEIASQVCQKRKDTVFLMVGDGSERGNLEQLTQNLRLNENVKFLGYQPWDRVAQIRLVSDVSLCLIAGFSLIEAAAAGTPIIAYNVDWHSELVKNNETGFLVPKGDIKGAANAILKLLDKPELSQRLGENARKLAIERHSLENTSKIKVKWYEELLGSQRTTGANKR